MLYFDHHSSGIPANQQHLLLGEKILSDNTTIADNNLSDGSTLRLVLSLQGGPIGTSRRMLPLDNKTIRQLVNLNKFVLFYCSHCSLVTMCYFNKLNLKI